MSEALSYFTTMTAQLAVLFVIFSFLVGLVRRSATEEKLRRLLSGGSLRGYLAGLGFGSLSPFCVCSTVPIVRGLILSGTSFGPTMAFMLASPLLNVTMIGIFAVLFGWQVTAIYAAIVLTFALATSFLWARLNLVRYVRNFGADRQATGPGSHADATESPSCACGSGRRAGLLRRATVAFDFAIGELRRALPFILVGTAVAALLRGFVPEDFIASIAGTHVALAVPGAALIGGPLYLTIESATVIGHGLLAQGAGIGTVMALIVGGSSTSIPELIMLRELFHRRLIAIYIVTSLTVATIAGYAFNLLLG